MYTLIAMNHIYKYLFQDLREDAANHYGRHPQMTRLEVIITDGVSQRRVIWVSIKKNGIYSFFTFGGNGNHSSYHKDGSLWRTFNGIRQRIAQFQPLNSFKGSHQLSSMAFTTEMSGSPAAPPYVMKKLDSAVYIDVRPYVKKKLDIGVNLTLLEPERYSSLQGIKSFAREIHLYPCFNPWLVITIYESDSQRRRTNPSVPKNKGSR